MGKNFSAWKSSLVGAMQVIEVGVVEEGEEELNRVEGVVQLNREGIKNNTTGEK